MANNGLVAPSVMTHILSYSAYLCEGVYFGQFRTTQIYLDPIIVLLNVENL
jgi:hypothetical protein